MDLLEIGSFIATRRKDLNVTQEQLANKICVTKQAISRWERNIGYPDIL